MNLKAVVLVSILAVFLINTSYAYQGYGWTTLALQSAEFTSGVNLPNGDFWSGKLWILTIAQYGLGQHVEGTISKESIGTLSGTTPQNDFKIEVDWDKQQCIYPIKFGTYTLYTYEYREWHCLWTPSEDEARNYCKKDLYARWKYRGAYMCGCISRHPVGYEGIFEAPYTKSTGTLRVTGAETASARLDTSGETGIAEGYVGNKVYVVWNGDLLRRGCPNYDVNYKPLYKEGEWKIYYKSSWDSYKRAMDDLEDFIYSKAMTGEIWWSERSQMVDKVNAVNDRLAEMYPISLGNIVGGQLRVDLEKAATNPIWTFYVKADFLKIYQPIPKFTIKAYDSECYGRNKCFLRVDITNYGETGCGTLSIVESDPRVKFAEPSVQVCVPSGSTVTRYLEYTAYAQSQFCQNIKLRMSSTGGVIEDTVKVCYEPRKVCSPGQTVCEGNIIKRCNPYGTGYSEFVKDCSREGKICSYDNYGNAICIDPHRWYCGDGVCYGNENYQNCPQDCQPSFISIITSLIWIAVAIAIVIIFLPVIIKFLKKKVP